MNRGTVERMLFAVPLVVLAGAFVGICVQAGTAWPWLRVVHEDGRRTLLDTIFYFEHAARELPLDLVLAVGVAGAMRTFWKPEARVDVAAILFAAVMVTICVGAIASVGWSGFVDNLAQKHTRPGAPFAWGSHWRFHLLERAALLAASFAASAVVHAMVERRSTFGRPSASFRLAIALFIVGTLLFRPTLEPFADPVFIGHQARELMTHGLVTLPLALGACLAGAGSLSCGAQERVAASHRTSDFRGSAVVAGTIALIVTLFLGVRTVTSDAVSHGQSASLTTLLLPHFFEHALTYLVVPLGALTVFGWDRADERR